VKARLFSWWEAVRSSFLFTPLVLVLSALVLATGTLWIDTILNGDESFRPGFLPQIGVEGSRLVLSTIAGSMMTVTSIVFSITVVTLTLASGQLGPRLLHNFRSDPANQFVLGIFLAIFVYCIAVLQTIRGGFEDTLFVPHLSIAVALILVLVGIATLIFFIHHISTGIQADELVSSVSQETQEVIKRLLPEESEEPPNPEGERPDPPNSKQQIVIRSDVEGYLCAIDYNELLGIATEFDSKIVIESSAGDFIPEGGRLLRIEGIDDEEDLPELRLKFAFVVGSRRTIPQDLEYGLSQLVEIALRALSPGINDPFTAIACIHRLAACLRLVAQRPDLSPVMYREQEPRLWRKVPDFQDLLDATWPQIREAAAGQTAVLETLSASLSIILECCQDPRRREAVHRERKKILQTAETRPNTTTTSPTPSKPPFPRPLPPLPPF